MRLLGTELDNPQEEEVSFLSVSLRAGRSLSEETAVP